MASTLPKRAVGPRREPRDESVVAVIDTQELERAHRDPRVHAFLEEADAYLADLERQDLNH